jgi:hypothetical protein
MQLIGPVQQQASQGASPWPDFDNARCMFTACSRGDLLQYRLIKKKVLA